MVRLLLILAGIGLAFIPLVFMSVIRTGKTALILVTLLSCAWLAGMGFSMYRFLNVSENDYPWVIPAGAGLVCVVWALLLFSRKEAK